MQSDDLLRASLIIHDPSYSREIKSVDRSRSCRVHHTVPAECIGRAVQTRIGTEETTS